MTKVTARVQCLGQLSDYTQSCSNTCHVLSTTAIKLLLVRACTHEPCVQTAGSANGSCSGCSRTGSAAVLHATSARHTHTAMMTQLRLGYDLVGSWINESWMQGNNTTCVLRSIGLSASQWPMTWLASHTSPTTQLEPTKLTYSQSRRSTQRQPITLKQLTSANHIKAHSDSQSCQSTQWQPIM